MLNSGIELEVGSQLDIIGKDIQWYGNVNYAYNLNRILTKGLNEVEVSTFPLYP